VLEGECPASATTFSFASVSAIQAQSLRNRAVTSVAAWTMTAEGAGSFPLAQQLVFALRNAIDEVVAFDAAKSSGIPEP